jgi:hypothetical protein
MTQYDPENYGLGSELGLIRFVKGHGFSRAANSRNIVGALAPEVSFVSN